MTIFLKIKILKSTKLVAPRLTCYAKSKTVLKA